MSIVTVNTRTKGTRFYARVHKGNGAYEYGAYRASREEAERDEGLILNPPEHVLTVDELCEWWIDGPEAAYPSRPRDRTGEPPRASTVQSARYSVKVFRAEFGPELADSLSKDALQRFCAAHRSAVSDIRTMYSDALRAEKVSVNLLDGMGRKGKRRRRPRDEFMTEDEFDLLVAIAAREEPGYPTLSALLEFMGWTGVRQSEAFCIARSDIDGDSLHVRWTRGSTGEITTPKNHKTRTIYLPMRAVQAVERVPVLIGSDLIFRNKHDGQLSRPAFYQLWKPIKTAFLREVGTERRYKLHDGPRAAGERGFVPHSLRHFCATWLLDKGESIEDVAWQLGTTEKEVRDTYGHPSDKARRERLSRAHSANVRDFQVASERRAENV